MIRMQPKIPVTITRTDRLIDTASLALLIALWLFAGYSWFTLPDIIPVHYNLPGQPDRFGGKITIFLLPLIATGIYLLMQVLHKNAHLLNYPVKITEANAPAQYAMGNMVMRLLKLSILIICLVIAVLTHLTAIGKANGLGGWFIPFMMVLLLAPTVVFLWQSVKKRH